MKSDPWSCDGCGKRKGETNHWFGVRLHPSLGTIVIMSFSKIPEEQMEQFELMCGHSCLLKRVDALAVTL